MTVAPEKAPAFQFYPADFLMDGNVQRMTLEERGAYITLLCLCWQERALPKDDRGLARMLGVTLDRYRKLWPALERCFQATDEGWTHKRLEKERAKQADFRRRQSDAGKASAANRKSTTVQPNGNHGSTGVQPKPNSSSSISDLPSSKEPKKERIAPKEPAQPVRPAFAHYERRFVDRYTGKPEYSPGKDGARMAKLLKAHGLPEVLQRFDAFFDSPDPWIQRSGHTLDVFFSSGTQTKLVAQMNGPPGGMSDTLRHNLASAAAAEQYISPDHPAEGPHGTRR